MNNNIILLQEYTQFDISEEYQKLITEASEKGDRVIVKNVLLQAYDITNGNGRVYPESVLKREDKKYQKYITEQRALGELDHPDSAIVNLDNVSHRIIKTEWQDNKLHGDLEVLYKHNNKGQKLLGFLQHGVKLGISSRGVGSLQKEGKSTVVQDDFELIAYDVVSTPSVPGAFLNLHESCQGLCINKIREKNDKLLQKALMDILGPDKYKWR